MGLYLQLAKLSKCGGVVQCYEKTANIKSCKSRQVIL